MRSVLSPLLRRRPSPAMVVALLALFVALGGSAWAAFVVSSNSQVAPNTIKGAAATSGNKNIVAGTLGSADLADHAVTTYKMAVGSIDNGRLANGAVTGGKVATNTLTGTKIDESTLGKVPTASNADALAGHDASYYTARCPVGTLGLIRNVCVDTNATNGPVSWLDASQTCTRFGLGLPSVSEAGIIGRYMNNSFWVDGPWTEGSTVRAWVSILDDDGVTPDIKAYPATTSVNYVCVSSPTDVVTG